jgi:hypothetical protein
VSALISSFKALGLIFSRIDSHNDYKDFYSRQLVKMIPHLKVLPHQDGSSIGLNFV